MKSGFLEAPFTQALLLAACHLLNLHLAFQGCGFIGILLDVHQSHRGTTTCVLGALARIVREQTLIEIIGDATIQGIVGATEKVTDPAQLLVVPAQAGIQSIK